MDVILFLLTCAILYFGSFYLYDKIKSKKDERQIKELHDEYELALQKAAKMNEDAGWKKFDSNDILVEDSNPLPEYEPKASGAENGHEYVDLGLPSGRLWAVCNIGATSADGSGSKYFAWGKLNKHDAMAEAHDEDIEVDNDEGIFWLDKYVVYYPGPGWGERMSGDGRQMLKANDDAAASYWEGGWHMPTGTDFEELLSHCKAQMAKCNDTEGVMLTGPNGASVFFPFSDRNDSLSPISYWSSDATAEWEFDDDVRPSAYAIAFTLHSDGSVHSGLAEQKRTCILPVRAVI